MSLWSRLSDFLSLSTFDPPPNTRVVTEGSIEDFYLRIVGGRTQPWRLPSVTEALGVPSIQRAVTLISNTTGMLTMQGFRNGALMPETPPVIARPDPYQTPRDFYREWAYLLASRGEAVHWIATRDFDDRPSALVAVPPAELTVEDNPRNRLLPRYSWGKLTGTRYSAANRGGEFLHTTYLREPGALRGVGPLQLAKAAISVSVEAQEWAANFYAGGASSNVLIKHASELSPEEDADGYNEAARLKSQWMTSDNNVPKVIDQNIEAVDYLDANPKGAQMLEAREHNNGDAARMFGMPGALVEYNAPGSSLTYQNIAEVYRLFLTSCLQPNYLEAIEQALSDLLPRSTVARFYVEGILRADIKTRFEVYEKAIGLGMLDADGANQLEGWAPGSPEVAPVPFSPPAAIPASLPETRTEVRCDGMHVKRIGGVPQLRSCNRLLSMTGRFEGACPRCKKIYSAA